MTKEISVREDVRTEISFWLDEYNDLFSDFDPRPFDKRALSDDFINQVKKMARDNENDLWILKLLLPEKLRQDDTENTIAKSLHSRFTGIHEKLTEKNKKLLKRGWLLTVSGAVLMMFAAYISFLQTEKYFVHVFLILFEPAGWFLLWSGMELLAYEVSKSKKETKFYFNLSRAVIEFGNY